MAAEIIATPGAPNATSYVTEEEFEDYLEARLNAPTADPDTMVKALIMATRRIDQEDFSGTPTRPLNDTGAPETQALKWPRVGARDAAGYLIDPETIPEIVKRATMELAIQLVAGGTTDFMAPAGLEGYEQITIGPISITPRKDATAGELPDMVVDILRPVLRTPRGMIRLQRA